MTAQTMVRRGMRMGAWIGAWPAGIMGSGCLVGAFVFLVGGQWGTVRALVSVGALAVLGSMAVGLALGTATGFVLAIAPRWLLTRPLLRGSSRRSPRACRSWRCPSLSWSETATPSRATRLQFTSSSGPCLW